MIVAKYQGDTLPVFCSIIHYNGINYGLSKNETGEDFYLYAMEKRCLKLKVHFSTAKDSKMNLAIIDGHLGIRAYDDADNYCGFMRLPI